jgi:flagellar protein FlaG
MENVTTGNSVTGAVARQAAPLSPQRREPDANSARAADVAAPEAPTISVAALAAEAEEGKLKSLSALETMTESMDDAVEVLNQALSLKNTSAVIRRDEQLNRYLVTIKDKESGEVVREIPDEALLKFARNLQEMRGILFDETT